MRISDAAKRCGLSASSIRFYERAGIVASPDRCSGSRRFTGADLAMLAWIARARNAGLSLADVRATLPSTAGIREHGAALVRTLVALDARRCELQAALAEVDRLHAEKRAELDSLTTALPAEFHAGA